MDVIQALFGTYLGLVSLAAIKLIGATVFLILALLFVLLIVVVVVVLAVRAQSRRLAASDKGSLGPMIRLRELAESIHNRLAAIGHQETKSLADDFATFREELAFAASDSVPGSEDVDYELVGYLEQIEQNVQILEQEREPSASTSELAQMTAQQVGRAREALRRREHLMGDLR